MAVLLRDENEVENNRWRKCFVQSSSASHEASGITILSIFVSLLNYDLSKQRRDEYESNSEIAREAARKGNGVMCNRLECAESFLYNGLCRTIKATSSASAMKGKVETSRFLQFSFLIIASIV